MIAGRRPTMVFGGSFWTGSTDQGLREGFRAAGWIVQDIDIRSYLASGSSSLRHRAASRLLRESAKQDYRAELVRACERLKPDLFFMVKGWAIDPDTLSAIRRHTGITALLYPDVDFAHEGVDRQILDDIDCVLTTKTYHLPFLRSLGLRGHIGFIPHGYCTAAHQPAFAIGGEVPASADIGYIGNFSQSKGDWILGLADALPEQRLQIIGARWTNALKGRGAILDVEQAFNAEFARAIQTSRINVAVHYGKTASGWEDLVSTRSFEIPACGGFMLHIDNDEIREYFTPGVEIDVFSSPDELVDKCRFYLGRPDLRETMIRQAYKRCVPAYSYDCRAKKIVAILDRDHTSTARRNHQ